MTELTLEVINPFPGFRPFYKEEEHYFFGRDKQIVEVLTRLGENRFMALLGDSGCGKSSLVKAGIFPALQGGFLSPYGSFWKIVEFRPQNAPIANLAKVIGELDFFEPMQLAEIETTLRTNQNGIGKVLEKVKLEDRENILIYVDQFEELFTFNEPDPNDELSETVAKRTEVKVFVNLLLNFSQHNIFSSFVMVTMRSEFLGRCTEIPGLTALINDGQYLVPRLTREQFKEVIEGPLLLNDVKISARLFTKILNDVPNDQDQLPILQHGLMILWKNWDSDSKLDEPIDLKHYEGLTESLNAHLNQLVDRLNDVDQIICRNIFQRISGNLSDNPGVRRPTTLSVLQAICGHEKNVVNVIDHFRSEGNTFLTPYPQNHQQINNDDPIDISHESIMRKWDRLKDWIKEEELLAKTYIDLSHTTLSNRAFWRDPDLSQALSLKNKYLKTNRAWSLRYIKNHDQVEDFLQRSQIAQEKELSKEKSSRRVKLALVAAGVLSIIFLGFGIWSNELRENAVRSSNEAEMAKQIATREKQKADIARAEAEKQSKLAKEAEAEAIEQKMIALVEKAKANSERTNAIQLKILAEKAQQDAEMAENHALMSKDLAQHSQKMAEVSAQEARALRMESIAAKMALTSLNIADDPELRLLLARQAWRFMVEYSDSDFDATILKALYSAQKQARNELIGTNANNLEHVRSIVIDQSGHFMYTADGYGSIYKNDLIQSTQSKLFDSNHSGISSMALTPDGNYLFATDNISVFSIDLRKETRFKSDHLNTNKYTSPRTVLALPNSKGFYLATGANKIFRIELNGGIEKINEIVKTKYLINSMAISRDGRYLAFDQNNGVQILDVLDKYSPTTILLKENKSSQYDNRVTCIQFNADGQLLAIGRTNGNISLWDMKDKYVYLSLVGHTARIHNIVFSPNGKLMATSSWDKSVSIHETTDWLKSAPRFERVSSNLSGLAFTPDGTKLVVSNKEKVEFIPLNMEEMAQGICGSESLGNNLSEREWVKFVAEDIEYEETCKGLPLRKIE